MALSDVLVGAPLTSTGGILAAPLGTAAPTDTKTALNVAYVPLGYAGEDGLTLKTDRSTDKIKAWGGATVRVLQKDFGTTIEFEFLETTAEVLKTVFGVANVAETAATSTEGTLRAIKITKDTLPKKAWVFEMKDDDARIRVSVPVGQITEVSDTKFTHQDVIRYKVTLECFEDSAGAYAYIYTNDGKTTV